MSKSVSITFFHDAMNEYDSYDAYAAYFVYNEICVD